jgi:hypothetical protein
MSICKLSLLDKSIGILKLLTGPTIVSKERIIAVASSIAILLVKLANREATSDVNEEDEDEDDEDDETLFIPKTLTRPIPFLKF